jgi:hypothetical protein
VETKEEKEAGRGMEARRVESGARTVKWEEMESPKLNSRKSSSTKPLLFVILTK